MDEIKIDKYHLESKRISIIIKSEKSNEIKISLLRNDISVKKENIVRIIVSSKITGKSLLFYENYFSLNLRDLGFDFSPSYFSPEIVKFLLLKIEVNMKHDDYVIEIT